MKHRSIPIIPGVPKRSQAFQAFQANMAKVKVEAKRYIASEVCRRSNAGMPLDGGQPGAVNSC